MVLTALLVGGGLLVVAWLWLVHRRQLGYWKRRGVPHPSPWPFFGNAFSIFTFRRSLSEWYADFYYQFSDAPYFGVYQCLSPQLVLRDPRLIEKVLVKDFGHFTDHGIHFNEKKNWIDAGLFNLNGNRWRALRIKMTPAFTTGKMKGMLDQMLASGDRLVEDIDRQIEGDIDAKEMLADYSNGVIGSCAFGLDMASRPDPLFKEMGHKILHWNTARYFGFLALFNWSSLASFLDFKFTPDDVAAYFSKLIRDTVEDRKTRGVTRNDFVQLMLQLQEKGSVEMSTYDKEDDFLKMNEEPTPSTLSFEVTDKIMIAQAYTFLTAGFDAISGAIMFTLLLLSEHPEAQETLRNEVRDKVAKHGGFTYQAIREMTYLSQCLDETLRLYPLVGFLFRRVTKTYRLDGELELEPGTLVVLPVKGLHSDPAYFPQPGEFRPERFANDAPITPFTYIPFGDGPRMCIGMRFAQLQMKVALAKIYHNFKTTLSPSAQLPVKLAAKTIVTMPERGLPFRFTKV